MKQPLLFILFIVLSVSGRAQNIDSMLAAPQVIELKISTPEPRLKETFEISIDLNHVRANIFRSFFDKVEFSEDIGNTDDGQMTMKVHALKKGRNEIGPLEFYLDKTRYTTNKIVYEVIDALPDTDNGLWFRKVMTSDTTFCIIIEQRIPASRKTTITAPNTTLYTTEPEFNEIAKFKDSYSIDGVSGHNAHSSTNFSSVEINGDDRRFMYGYSVYYFTIKNKKAKIKITKDKFQNLPDGYKFEDIIIQ